jgi:hypothetical protein
MRRQYVYGGQFEKNTKIQTVAIRDVQIMVEKMSGNTSIGDN